MQNGDLEEFHPQRLIFVLEGVLALVVDEKATVGWIRKHEETVSYHIHWYDLPLKRLIVIGERYPDVRVEIVTFKSEKLADLGAEFLNRADIPYSSIEYRDYAEFVALLRYQRDVRAIYDVEPERLDDYGQLGVAAIREADFHG